MLTILIVALSCLMPVLGQHNMTGEPLRAYPQPIKNHPVPLGCVDQFAQVSYCPIWRQMGYCSSHAPLMRPYCAKTCGLCNKPLLKGTQPVQQPVKPYLNVGPVKQQVFHGVSHSQPSAPHLLNDHAPAQGPAKVPAKPFAHKMRHLRRPTTAQAKLRLKQLMRKHPRINQGPSVNPLATFGNRPEGGGPPQGGVQPMVPMDNNTHSKFDMQDDKLVSDGPQEGGKGPSPVHMPPPAEDEVLEDDYTDTAPYDDQTLDGNGEPESGRPMQGHTPNGMKVGETVYGKVDDSPEFHDSTEGTGDLKALSDSSSADKESEKNHASWWKSMADKYEHLTEDLQKELQDEREQFRERMQEKQNQIFQLEELVQQQKAASTMIHQDKVADSQALKPDVVGRPRLNMAPWQMPFLGNTIPNIDTLPFSRSGNSETLLKSIGNDLEPLGLDPKVSIAPQAMYDANDSQGNPSEFVANWSEEMGTGKSKIQKKKKKVKRLSKKKTKLSHKMKKEKP